MEFISLPFGPEFRKFYIDVVSRPIDDSCQWAAIKPRKILSGRILNGERRTRAKEYYASIDWTNSTGRRKVFATSGIGVIAGIHFTKNQDLLSYSYKKEGWAIHGYQDLFSDKTAWSRPLTGNGSRLTVKHHLC